jgi:hypothetical protein
MAELEIRSLQCSRARTGRDSHWDDGGKTRIFDDWVVTLAGTVEADVGQVARVAAALIRVGVSVGYIHWQLDKLNPAFRQVRKDAVSDAKRAAEDFADALGGRLGVLITLADPGLGGMSSLAPGQGGAVARADGFGPLGKAAAGDEFDDELNLDPEQVEICAAVEACYQVELTDRTS